MPVTLTYPSSTFLPGLPAQSGTAQTPAFGSEQRPLAAAAQVLSPQQQAALLELVDTQFLLPALCGRLASSCSGSCSAPVAAAAAGTSNGSAHTGGQQQDTPQQQYATPEDSSASAASTGSEQPADTHSSDAAATPAGVGINGFDPNGVEEAVHTPLLHYGSAVFALLVLFLAGLFHFLVDKPLLGWPSALLQRLLAAANEPVWRPDPQQQPVAPSARGRRVCTPNHAGTLSRKRRHSQQRDGSRWVRYAARMRQWCNSRHFFSGNAVFARLALFLLLLCTSCTVTASAMQLPSALGLGESLSSSLQRMQLGTADHGLAEQAMQLLGHELGALHRSCFRSCGAAG